MAELSELTIDLSIGNIEETVTELKRVQREAKEATRAVREFESAHYGPRIDVANDMLSIQGADGNWNYDAYMHGMYNGMEIVLSTIEGREPSFRDAPIFISGKDLSSVPTYELQRELETREGVTTYKLGSYGSYASLRLVSADGGKTEFIEGPAIVTVNID